METIETFIHNLSRTIRPADIIDIGLVALFLYVVISWLQHGTSRSVSRRIVVVLCLFIGGYVLAHSFELYMVDTLLRVLLIVFLLAVVVVFQSDIRRMLDRLGSWSLIRHDEGSAPSARTVNLLTEAAARMAEMKMGALIVIKGDEPWDSHIQGGIELQGKVSRPLLYSIFHDETPGHDGAVLMKGDCVTHFGAHLPLSTNLPAVSRFGGTRHAAALGLSEECDAFVIAVSEERGTISVAHEGELTELASASELRIRLNRFWDRHYGGQSAVRQSWRTQRSIRVAAVSLTLSALLWLLFAYSPDVVYRTYDVPIAFRNLPPNWALENDVPSNVQVTLSGTEQAFTLLDPASLIISFDLSEPMEGLNTLVIDDDNLQAPAKFNLYNVNPQEIHVEALRQVPVALPIQVRTTGTLPDSLELLGLRPTPDSITLLLPQQDETPPSHITTEPVDLRQITGSVQMKRSLTLPPGARLGPDQNAETTVSVEVQSRRTP